MRGAQDIEPPDFGCRSRADADFNQTQHLGFAQRRKGSIACRFLELLGILQQRGKAFRWRHPEHHGSGQHRASKGAAPGLIHARDAPAKGRFQAEIRPRDHILARGSKSQPARPSTRLPAKTAKLAR